jgi:SOS-response transcriptional repressor LexA
MKQATDKQAEVLKFIATFIATNRYSPSIQEIATHFSINVNAASDFVKALEKKSLISVAKRQARGIAICNSPEFSFEKVKKVASICLGPKNFAVLMHNIEQSMIAERAK